MSPSSGPAFETRSADWLTYREALGCLTGEIAPLAAVELPLSEAAGCAIAREVRSALTLPPGPTSHMDGYALAGTALRGADAGLSVVGSSLPGRPHPGALGPGEAIRVMTGALLPPGADTVLPVEDTDREAAVPGQVRLRPRPRARIEPGMHVRSAGEEMREGDLLAAPGDAVDAGRLLLLSATGRGTLPVHPRPRVSLLVTGDELVPAGDPGALEGGIRRADILSPTLPLLLERAGAKVAPPLRVPDDPEALQDALARAAGESDLVLTTGGASMGEADLVKGALDRLGWVPRFWRIRIRPGSPASFGWLPRGSGEDRVPVLGLPGNPVSALVTTLILAIPAIRTLGGHHGRRLRGIRATAGEAMEGPAHLTRFHRVVLRTGGEGRWTAHLTGGQGSGVLRSVGVAEGLAVLPEGTPAIAAGDPLEVLLLPDAGWVACGTEEEG